MLILLQTVKLLLGRDHGSQQEAVGVNVTNKSGFTALDVSDVVQQMVGEPIDFITRDLLLRAEALRGSEVEDVETTQVHHRQISVTTLPPQTLWQFLLHDISLLNPCRFWEIDAGQNSDYSAGNLQGRKQKNYHKNAAQGDRRVREAVFSKHKHSTYTSKWINRIH
jgi:hypothetical protein